MVAFDSMSASLLAQLVAQCPDGVIFSDTNGIIRFWNAAAVRIFGFSVEQALGKRLDIIIPDKLRAPHWRGFDAAMTTGVMKHPLGTALPTKALCADGSTIYVELSFAVIVDQEQQPIGALAQARDIHQRYLAARADRKRLIELEKLVAKSQE